MAYTIVKSDGTVLTTIPDGTINTTSTSLGLPGRNYAGYGSVLDTNYVHLTENFAKNTPPANPLRGQLWYNPNDGKLNLCPTDGESNAAAWLSLSTTSSGGNTTFGSVTVTNDLLANNITATNALAGGTLTVNIATVSTSATINNATLTGTTAIANTFTTVITSGNAITGGTMTGTWTMVGGGTASTYAGTTTYITGGNLVISNVAGGGLKIDPTCLYDLAGNPISFTGTYNDANVAAFLPTYTGNVGFVGGAAVFNGRTITTGANTTAGSLTGNWTLTAGSRLQATYADLAERHHSDALYPIGTIVKVGGINEITQTTKFDCSDVLGVVSNTAAYLMNAEAGSDATHPAIAFTGRVKVRILGAIEKGNKITTGVDGCAIASSNGTGFGWAVESNNDVDEKLVLCIIK